MTSIILWGSAEEAKPQTVAKEANMERITKKKGNGKHVNFDGKACWVGVDVHKSSYAVAVMDEEGQRLEFSTPAEPKRVLLQLLKMGMSIKALVYESGPTGYSLAWACQEAGIPVVVAAPSRIPRPVSKTGKTDRLDSMKLVEFLSQGMLRSIAIPTRQEFELREMERARQHLVKLRRETRQVIRSFLLRNGLEEPSSLDSWGTAAVRALREMSLPDALRRSLDVYLKEHDGILEAISRITKDLADVAVQMGYGERVKHLLTIPGVGETIAHTFAAEIFRPERFRRSEEICAYVGLSPVTRHSGAGREHAWLRPVGQRYLRSILVQAAWRLLSVEGYYRDFYNRIRGRTGLMAKAITAVARKLLVILWRIAIEGRAYKPMAAD
jgi:transposase